jgi:hypothetical protein
MQKGMLTDIPGTKAVTTVCNVALQLKEFEIILHVAVAAATYMQAMIIASVIGVDADRKASCRRRPGSTSCTENKRGYKCSPKPSVEQRFSSPIHVPEMRWNVKWLFSV